MQSFTDISAKYAGVSYPLANKNLDIPAVPYPLMASERLSSLLLSFMELCPAYPAISAMMPLFILKKLDIECNVLISG
jgi:hypothetical protein